VVYGTDAATGSLGASVSVLYRVPASEAPPVVYWAAPVAGGNPAAARFLEYLEGPEAGAVFRRYGFRHLPTEPEPDGG
jgi:molybdate transport system substrate-binding protein